MPHETILLISADAELRAWLNGRVLLPGGYVVAEAPDLVAARSQLTSLHPHLLLVVLSSQAADELALVAECEPNVPALVIAPHRSLEVWEAALAHGASDVLARPLDAIRVINAVARGAISRIQRALHRGSESSGPV
jgi:DNA-binding NtrC family response regulator